MSQTGTVEIKIPQKELAQVLAIPQGRIGTGDPTMWPLIEMTPYGIACTYVENMNMGTITRTFGGIDKKPARFTVEPNALRRVKSRLVGAEPTVRYYPAESKLTLTTTVATWELVTHPAEFTYPTLTPTFGPSPFSAAECKILGTAITLDDNRPALTWAVANAEHNTWVVTDSYVAIAMPSETATIDRDGLAVPVRQLGLHSKSGCTVEFEVSDGRQVGVRTRSEGSGKVVTTTIDRNDKRSVPGFPSVYSIPAVGKRAHQTSGEQSEVDRHVLVNALTGCPGEPAVFSPWGDRPHRSTTVSNAEGLGFVAGYSAPVGMNPPEKPTVLNRTKLLRLLRVAPESTVRFGWDSDPVKPQVFESGQLVAVLMPIRIAQ